VHRNFLQRHKDLAALIDQAAGGQRPISIPARKTGSHRRAFVPDWQRPNTATENCSRKCRSWNTGSERKDHRLVLPNSITIPSSSNSASA
jgi:hypothetical protein